MCRRGLGVEYLIRRGSPECTRTYFGNTGYIRGTISLFKQKSVRTIPRRRVTSVEKSPSGRERHDEKITVYLSADELFDLDQARLMLRGDLGLAVDCGRIVCESITVIVADLEAKGDQSILADACASRKNSYLNLVGESFQLLI